MLSRLGTCFFSRWVILKAIKVFELPGALLLCYLEDVV